MEEDSIKRLLDLEAEKRDLQEAFLSADDPELADSIALEIGALEGKIERVVTELEKEFNNLFMDLF